MADQEEIVVAVRLLSGAVVAENLRLPASSTVSDVKGSVEAATGTLRPLQQLVLGADMLADERTLRSLTADDSLTLLLVRREAVQFTLEISAEVAGTVVMSPEFHVPGTQPQRVQLEYHHEGFDSRLLKPGMCSIFLDKPLGSLLRCRVWLNGECREKLFSEAFGQIGWTNFCERPQLPCEIVLEVLHLGTPPKPTESGGCIEWDLREALGGMPYLPGQQVKSDNFDLDGAELRLVFFPSGTTGTPNFHTTLWVMPITGLEDRRYVVEVDGNAQTGTGEAWLNFPRPERFGQIRFRLEAEDERERRRSLRGVGAFLPSSGR